MATIHSTMKVLCWVLPFLTAAFGAPHLPGTSKALVPTLDGRIIGGTVTTIDKYPYQISLQYYGSHICGGSLISKTWVVTAAHCTYGSSASVLSVRVGSSTVNSGGNVHSVSQIIQHRSYNSATIDYDISLLALASSVSNANAIPIAMVEANTAVNVGETSTITGWGTTSEGGSISSQLRYVQVPVVSQATCKSAYGSSAITDRMLCAGYTSGGKDACQGDSGGPLVVNGRLTGIVSWGYGCARPYYPGVYSSVSNLRSWVASNSGI